MSNPEQEELMSDPALVDEVSPKYFSSAPKSGQFSPVALKLFTELLIWLCSLIVIGNLANQANKLNKCYSLCVSSIVFASFSFIIISALLLLHLMSFIGKMSGFSSRGEMYLLCIPLLFWIPGVSTLSSVQKRNDADGFFEATGVAQFFGWLAFFACLYGAFKAYQAGKEEALRQKMTQRIAAQMRDEEEQFANYS